METATQPKSALNVKLIVPFINSTRNVLTTMVGVTSTIERPSVKGVPIPAYDVSGIIGFTGDIQGNVVVSFPREVATKIVSTLSGAEIDIKHPDFADGVGEVTNMIAGGAKKDLGANAGITCPSVIIGSGHTIARLKDVPCLVIPCTTPFGSFAIEVSIKQVNS